MVPGDDRRELEIRSPFDGSRQRGVLSLPADWAGPAPSPGAGPDGRLPLVIAPHPFGWSVEEDYHGGCAGLKAAGHRGWLGVPSEAGVAVLQPEGHHRVVERCSMGYEGGVLDVAAWIEAVDGVVRVDRERVYACGLSMGGQESLLMAGSHPDRFAAVFVFNPVVDPAAWQEDLARTANAELRAEGSDELIAAEVGGAPDAVPDAYARRNAFSVVDGLRSIPISIWWSPLDLVVPRQVERHGKRLYDELKRLDPDAPVSEYNHTARCPLSAEPTDDERWGIHETSDYAFATRWLLLHRRRA
jgi:pimeloyl-ACP methyl ester carboxylesterase